MAMPRFAGGTPFISLPSIRRSPEVCSSSPAMTRSSVDFPQPDGPTQTTNSPVLTSSSTFLRTSVAPKRLRMAVRASEPMRSVLLLLAHVLVGEPDSTSPGHALEFDGAVFAHG